MKSNQTQLFTPVFYGENFLYKDFHAVIEVVEAWGHWKKRNAVHKTEENTVFIQYSWTSPHLPPQSHWLRAVWIKRWLAALQTILSSEWESRRAQYCLKARRQFFRSATTAWERTSRDYPAYSVTKRQYSNTVSHCVSPGISACCRKAFFWKQYSQQSKLHHSWTGQA